MSGNSILNTDLNVSGITTSTRFIGSLEEIYIDPGVDGQILSTVLGATAWVNNEINADQIVDGVDGQIIRNIGGTATWQNEILAANIPADSISTARLQDEAVTPAKIQPGADGQVLTTVGGVVTWQAPIGSSTIATRAAQVITGDGVIVPIDTFELNDLGLINTANVFTGFGTGYYRFDFNAGYNSFTSGEDFRIALQESTVDQKAIILSQITLLAANIAGSYTLQGFINNPTSVRFFVTASSGSITLTDITLFVTKLS